jgi:Mn-dependent DtxR family transcriptional regulator
MVIDQAHGFYRLRLGDGISMRLRAYSKSTVRPNKIEHLVFYLQRVKNAGVSFSAKDLAAELQISQRTVNRLLKEACEAEYVEQIGKGRSTLFKLKNKGLAA